MAQMTTSSTRSSSQESEPDSVGSRRRKIGGGGGGPQVDSDATSSSSATPTPTDAETASVHSAKGSVVVAGGSGLGTTADLEREGSTCSNTDVASASLPESLGSSFRRKMTPAERLRVKKLVLLNPTLEAS